MNTQAQDSQSKLLKTVGIVGQAIVNFGLLNSGSRIAIQKIEKFMAGS